MELHQNTLRRSFRFAAAILDLPCSTILGLPFMLGLPKLGPRLGLPFMLGLPLAAELSESVVPFAPLDAIFPDSLGGPSMCEFNANVLSSIND